jgi:hypothetical protein
MPITTKYLLVVSMDVEPEKEALFNEVYDTEHVPNMLKVPGVVSVTRLKQEPLTMSIGGENRTIVIEGTAIFTAIYEIESPEVLVSSEWATLVEEGRWADQVRPYTKNRSHVLRKVMDAG